MKNRTQKIVAAALIFASASVAMAFERETGGRVAPRFQVEYECFNRAQLADAPMVEILLNADGSHAVSVKNRGYQSAYGLTQVSATAQGTSYVGQGLTAFLNADGVQAEVTLLQLQLTYKCERAK